MAQNTHLSIRSTALKEYQWPEGMQYDTYLQGSYKNWTNIRSDSDVDLVVELTSVFYSNLTDLDKQAMGLSVGKHNWDDFKNQVVAALKNSYDGSSLDLSGSKSIKLLPKSGRLKADIVVAVKYRRYSSRTLSAEGITFWTTPDRRQIINYPNLHYEHGNIKNDDNHSAGCFKPTVRVIKSARSRIVERIAHLDGRFPSYFVECLLYNVPDRMFVPDYQRTFCNVVNWLQEQFTKGLAGEFVCQNNQFYLFGADSIQWNINDAQELVDQLIALWNSK